MAKAKRIPLSEGEVFKAMSGAKPFIKQIADKAAGIAPDNDVSLARIHHDALKAALGPVMAALDAARADGYLLGFSLQPNAQGNQELRLIEVRKDYRF